jgi:hypothetical protein
LGLSGEGISAGKDVMREALSDSGNLYPTRLASHFPMPSSPTFLIGDPSAFSFQELGMLDSRVAVMLRNQKIGSARMTFLTFLRFPRFTSFYSFLVASHLVIELLARFVGSLQIFAFSKLDRF